MTATYSCVRVPMTMAERFWSKVNIKDDEGCWLWMGTRYSATGYGRYNNQLAHRLAWEIEYGQIPEGRQVLHRCDVRHCVRPTHLFLGTQADNMRDMVAKGRHGVRTHPERWTNPPPVPRSREDHPNALLTAKAVADIRRRAKAGQSFRSIAEHHGISKSTAWQIARGKSWR